MKLLFVRLCGKLAPQKLNFDISPNHKISLKGSVSQCYQCLNHICEKCISLIDGIPTRLTYIPPVRIVLR